MNIGINRKIIFEFWTSRGTSLLPLSSFHWYGTWLKKSLTHSDSGSQRQGRDKFDASFSWGHLLRKVVRHPSLSILVIIFIWIDKGDVVFNSVKIIWNFNVMFWEMLIWLENIIPGIRDSENFHYLQWRLVADYPGQVTTYFRTQCHKPVYFMDLICDI